MQKREIQKKITKTEQTEKIIAYGEKSLQVLVEFFTDSTLANVKSECQKRNLTKGEIAIILADRIENMPYAPLTGVQICLLEFCENNSNWIEYYFPWVKNDGIEKFKEKYTDWLASYDRKSKSERRKEKRKFKKEKTL